MTSEARNDDKLDCLVGFVVELEQGVWLCDGDSDPSRTLVREHATVYPTSKAATDALCVARTFRRFRSATIKPNAEHDTRHEA